MHNSSNNWWKLAPLIRPRDDDVDKEAMITIYNTEVTDKFDCLRAQKKIYNQSFERKLRL